jgi:DNA-binding CsgD family transcriptional regulator
VNSRVRVGSAAPELSILDERHFTTAADVRRNPEYGEVVRRVEIGHLCLSPLLRTDDLLIGAGVIRTQAQGELPEEARRAFAAIAPHIRAAVRTQMAVEEQGLRLLTGALDAMSVAAFVCDVHGRVRMMTPKAETLVADGSFLRVRQGVLLPANDRETLVLHGMIAASAGSTPPPPVVVHGLSDGRPLLIEASVIPEPHAPRLSGSVLLVARVAAPDEDRVAEAARALFGLTVAEARIAALMVAGRSPQAIAEAQGVSVGTVRTHIHRIYEKAAVSSQMELVAAIPRF